MTSFLKTTLTPFKWINFFQLAYPVLRVQVFMHLLIMTVQEPIRTRKVSLPYNNRENTTLFFSLSCVRVFDNFRLPVK